MGVVIGEVARKLGYRPGMACAVIGNPPGLTYGLPSGATAAAELILAFAQDRAPRAEPLRDRRAALVRLSQEDRPGALGSRPRPWLGSGDERGPAARHPDRAG